MALGTGIVRNLTCLALALALAACGPATGGHKADSGSADDGGGSGDGGGGGDGGTGDAGPLPCASSCSLGAKSCDGNAVRSCNAVGMCNDWSAGAACGGATPLCSGGVCVATCSNQCTAGATYCSQAGFRTCITAATGCTEWSAGVTACPINNVCSGGGCNGTCIDRCAANATQCSGSGVQSCERKSTGCLDWSDPRPCAAGNVCQAGMCQTTCSNTCAAGDMRCSGTDSIQQCATQASGCRDFSPAQLCSGGGTCTGNMCMACTSGAMRCSAGGDVEQCTTGTWTQVSSCPFGCSNGVCTTMVTCTPGSHRCGAGGSVEICNSSGTAYLYIATCAGACSAGLCTGACSAGQKRCNGLNVETCNAGGTAWAVSDSCSTFCDAPSSQCASPSLDVTSNMNLDGEHVYAGAVVVHTGATLTSPTGNLTIRAASITVELGGSIVVSPTGDGALGRAANGTASNPGYPAGGGGYAVAGQSTGTTGGSVFGSDNDSAVAQGGRGGSGSTYGGSVAGAGGHGGGMLRLIADHIVLAGQVTANGEMGGTGTGSYWGPGGGGAGGGILIAADDLSFTGAASASGGAGGTANVSYGYVGGLGGLGRVRILYGATKTLTGTVTGQKTQGLLPPLTITSSTHPDPNLIYNDDFPTVALTWSRAFPARQGYYQATTTTAFQVPTPGSSAFDATELVSVARTGVSQGSNYFHIVPIDAMSMVGTVESTFRIQVNTMAPTITSTSHPSQTAWVTNPDVFYAWTFATADANLRGAYYVLDHYGSTVPTDTATFLPVTQKQILRSGLTAGIWAFHVVSVDQRGYLTKQAAHYQVRIGANPGMGTLLGKVVNASSANVGGANVTINRGLFTDQQTLSDGNYNFGMNVPYGTWEVTVTKTGYQPQTRQVTIDATTPSPTLNFTLAP